MEQRTTCVFCEEWLAGIESFDDPEFRCQLYEAILHYALYDEEPDLPAGVAPMWAMFKAGIDRNSNRFNKAIEQRRNAVRSRWQKYREKKAEEAKNTGDTTVYTEYDRTKNIRPYIRNTTVLRNTENTDIYEMRCDEMRCDEELNDSKDKPSNHSIKNTPQPPLRGSEGGGGEKGFKSYLGRVAAAKVPAPIVEQHYADQYVWRVVEGMPAFARAVSALVAGEKAGMTDDEKALYYREGMDPLLKMKKYFPVTEYQQYLLAVAAQTLSDREKEALCEEVDRAYSHGEVGLWQTMLDKIDYLKRENITSPEGFFKTRKGKVSFKKH